MQNAYRIADIRAAEQDLLATGVDLMQRAAMGLATVCLEFLREVRGGVYGARVTLVVGAGNNGGDALWAGALMARRGVRVEVVSTTDTPHAPGLAALTRAGGRLVSAIDPHADLIVDGLVGIGAQGALREPAAHLAEEISEHSGHVVSVDVPSGVDPQTGAVAGAAVSADVTVTFGCLKPGLLLMPGLPYVGRLVLVDIGLQMGASQPIARVLEAPDVSALLPTTAIDAYKYSRGVVGIAAGSHRYPGAAQLCVGGARLAEIGMVEILDRGDGVAQEIRQHFPDVIVAHRLEDPRIRSWGAGSGFIGDHSDHDTMVALLDAPVALVIDAGGITAIATDEDLRARLRTRRDRGLTTVLTPHDGEFERLASTSKAQDRLTSTEEVARALGCIVVRKGPGTVIADGEQPAFIDTMGTAVLATAGSGDVLTGLCAASLAMPGNTLEQVAAAVWIHGCAGIFAAEPVTAPAIVEAIPEAMAWAREAP